MTPPRGTPQPSSVHTGLPTGSPTGSPSETASAITPSVTQSGSPAGLMANPVPRRMSSRSVEGSRESALLDPGTQPRLLGLPLWTHGRAVLFELLSERLASPGQVDAPLELHSVNAEISIQVRSDTGYRLLLTRNPINLPDGEWVKRLCGLKYGRQLERISGSDMVLELCELAHREGHGVFFLGASEEVSAEATRRLGARFPSIALDRFAPPFEAGPDVSPEITREALARIAAVRPKVLCAFLGSPKQELWLRAHKAELGAAGVRVVLGAGAGLDFLSGHVRRAPALVSRSGFEWLWRLAHQPRARFGRIISRLPRFFALGLIEASLGRLRGVRTPQPPLRLAPDQLPTEPPYRGEPSRAEASQVASETTEDEAA